jgi:hypothetical protein
MNQLACPDGLASSLGVVQGVCRRWGARRQPACHNFDAPQDG